MTERNISAPDLLPGLSDPVRQSQQCFRAVLAATSRPGSIQTVPSPAACPDGWSPALTAIALSLLDQDTPVWLDPAAASPQAVAHLRFHCGCPIITDPQKAAFAIICSPESGPALHRFSIGDPQYPERAATILLSVEGLTGGVAQRWTGPGIQTAVDVAPRGLPAGFVAQWSDNHALYPSGVDVLLIAGTQVMGLPRSIAIQETC